MPSLIFALLDQTSPTAGSPSFSCSVTDVGAGTKPCEPWRDAVELAYSESIELDIFWSMNHSLCLFAFAGSCRLKVSGCQIFSRAAVFICMNVHAPLRRCEYADRCDAHCCLSAAGELGEVSVDHTPSLAQVLLDKSVRELQTMPEVFGFTSTRNCVLLAGAFVLCFWNLQRRD